MAVATTRFPSPFELATPPGAEGWEELYTYNLLCSDDRRPYEEGTFWFQDSMHWREALFPFDSITMEMALTSLSQYNTRFYIIPPALGVDYRVVNGYCYLSPVAILDGATIQERIPHFLERAGYYFQNWNTLYEAWKNKTRELIGAIAAIDFAPLPTMVPGEWVTEGRGIGSNFDMQAAYNRLIELCYKGWQYHFEFLNLGYAAYLDFFGFCKQAFPDIPEQSIAKMVSGIEVDLFRPDDELKRLAQIALDEGVADVITGSDDVDAVLAELAKSAGGRAWLAELEVSKDPWFNYNSGTGMYHHDKVWLDHLDIPFGFLRTYIQKLQDGVDLRRPLDALRVERERIADEYAELLPSDEEREAFRGKLELARTVFPYIENHNFYIEHWLMATFWRKVRELGQVFADAGFWPAADDIFYLRRDEIPVAIFDLSTGWAVGTSDRGSKYWPREVERRRRIREALQAWTPPPALGTPPEVITEPFTIMLWGITSQSISTWLEGGADNQLTGFAGSPGTAEGLARVVTGSADLEQVQPGEVLVCPITAPSWGPVFTRIAGVVTDIGGMMSHAAIVCREYGLPAVVGTGFGTQKIKTGQRVRVDGKTGTVQILE
jgi:pyruvate, water dikinase